MGKLNFIKNLLHMKVKNNIFFVTGGASGLGESCVRLFHDLGGKVVIADFNKESGKKLENELGPRSLFCHINVASEESVKTALETTVKKFGTIHGVFNCAGIGLPRRVLSKRGTVAPLEQFKKVIDVNLVGTFNVLRLASKIMSNNKLEDGSRGVIINVASVAAFDGQIAQASYSASKGGVVGMTLPIARDLGTFGIRICTVAPGMFGTNMTSVYKEDYRKRIARQMAYPLRFGHPVEFARLCQHITENEYLNGEVIRLDAGIRMGSSF